MKGRGDAPGGFLERNWSPSRGGVQREDSHKRSAELQEIVGAPGNTAQRAGSGSTEKRLKQEGVATQTPPVPGLAGLLAAGLAVAGGGGLPEPAEGAPGLATGGAAGALAPGLAVAGFVGVALGGWPGLAVGGGAVGVAGFASGFAAVPGFAASGFAASGFAGVPGFAASGFADAGGVPGFAVGGVAGAAGLLAGGGVDAPGFVAGGGVVPGPDGVPGSDTPGPVGFELAGGGEPLLGSAPGLTGDASPGATEPALAASVARFWLRSPRFFSRSRPLRASSM